MIHLQQLSHLCGVKSPGRADEISIWHRMTQRDRRDTRRRSELATTETLLSPIAIPAMSGPESPSNPSAATGMAHEL